MIGYCARVKHLSRVHHELGSFVFLEANNGYNILALPPRRIITEKRNFRKSDLKKYVRLCVRRNSVRGRPPAAERQKQLLKNTQ